jgi:hypothetical protein
LLGEVLVGQIHLAAGVLAGLELAQVLVVVVPRLKLQ